MLKKPLLLLVLSILYFNYTSDLTAQNRYKSERNADVVEYTVKDGFPIGNLSFLKLMLLTTYYLIK